MKNKQMDDQLDRQIRDVMQDQVPEPELLDKKMKDAYQQIRNMKTTKKLKKELPVTVKFSAAAAILAFAIVYCVKNPAIAAQVPLIGNIFRVLERQVHFPGDYSGHSIRLDTTSDDQDNNTSDGKPGDGSNGNRNLSGDSISDGKPSGDSISDGKPSGDSISDGKPSDMDGGGQPGQTDDQERNASPYRKESDGVIVTLSEVAYDHNAIYLAILVQNENGFAKDVLYENLLMYSAKVRLHKKDGTTETFRYKSEGLFCKDIEGEFTDPYTFQGIYQFVEPGTDLSECTACDLIFEDFQQQLTTGEEETIIVPDYGEVVRTIHDSVHYTGPWKFRLDLDGMTISEQEIMVHDADAQGFGIEKVVKTPFEMYAVPILPEGENIYDYVVTIQDADGKALEPRNSGKYLSMSHYGRDVSRVTVYLLKTEDFLDNKGENSYLQPGKAIYQTTVSFGD